MILGVLWAGLVVAVGIAARPRSVRRVHSDAPVVRHHGRRWPTGVVEGLGRSLRTAARRPPDPDADRWLGRAVLVGLAPIAVDPVAGAGLATAVWAWGVRSRRLRARREVEALHAELPDVVDLLRLVTSSGATVAVAVRAVADRVTGRLGAALQRAVEAVDAGDRLADALERLPATLGEPVRPLVRALVASERYGVPLVPALDQLAIDSRRARRQRAESAARRIPVKLLFPLVVCILPAFALLTVVPAVATTLQTIRS